MERRLTHGLAWSFVLALSSAGWANSSENSANGNGGLAESSNEATDLVEDSNDNKSGFERFLDLKAIAGIDEDKNGVRDDVDPLLLRLAGGDQQSFLALQLAAKSQRDLQLAETQTMAHNAMRNFVLAGACLLHARYQLEEQDAQSLLFQLQKAITDTPLRHEALLRPSRWLAELDYPVPPKKEWHKICIRLDSKKTRN